MKPETAHILRIIVSILIVLVPLGELIFKKTGKGLRRISGIGWALAIIAVANAFLNEYQFKDNPYLFPSEAPSYYSIDSNLITLKITIKNFKGGTAKNIKAEYVSLYKKNGSYDTSGVIFLELAETQEIPENGIYTFMDKMKYKQGSILDTALIYFRLIYNNEDNDTQEPTREIFQLPTPPKLMDLILDANHYQYLLAKEILVDKNLW